MYLNVIEVSIKNKKAVRTNDAAYTCDNSDFTVVFSFDEEWNAFPTKTARFAYDDKFQDVVFSGNKCPMPKISNTKLISVGVFAGDLHTSTPAMIVANKSILGASGVPDEPSPDVYAQIVELCNETKDIARSVRDDADNGVFDGEDGKDAVVDQTYNSDSENAQSGKAVAEAVKDKVDKVKGKGLSTNDFTDEYKSQINENTGMVTVLFNNKVDKDSVVSELVNEPNLIPTMKVLIDNFPTTETTNALINSAIGEALEADY